MQGSAAGPALCPGDGVLVPLCPDFPSAAGRPCQAGVPLLSSGALWDPQAASSEKIPCFLTSPLSSEVLRRWKMPPWHLAKSKKELPVGTGKLSRGLLPSTSVLGSISAGNVPFPTSPALLCPRLGLGDTLTLLGLGVSASSPPLAGIFVQEGSLSWEQQPGAFPFAKPSSRMAKPVVPQGGWGR